MPPQPANHGTGNGVLGVLPASSAAASPPPQAWPMPSSRRPAGAAAAGRSSRTAPSSPPPRSTPAGSSRSARWRAKAKRARASKPRAARPGPARQGRVLHRTGGRQGRPQAVPRPLCRPRPRSGRSGVPDAEALRHLLHHRPELILKGRRVPILRIKNAGASRRHFRIPARSCGKSPRCKLLVKNLQLILCEG